MVTMTVLSHRAAMKNNKLMFAESRFAISKPVRANMVGHLRGTQRGQGTSAG
jgi:hypothetical protein